MANILPFRAIRYSTSLRKKASKLLAPPYDVISREQKKELLKNDPANAIRLIVGNPSVETHRASDYAAAANTLKTWRGKGVLDRDDQPSLYVYQQRFKVEGRLYLRTGFLALSRLEPFGRSKGGILAHEFTLAGPKADRLNLMKKANANFSPIFSLYPDQGGVGKILARVTAERPEMVARFPKDVENRLWAIRDPQTLAAIQERMQSVTLFIADGHHRYETALAYQALKRKGDKSPLGSRPYDWVMMMFVAMEDPGLVILPTHRCLAPGRITDPTAFLESLARLGKLSVAPGNLRTLKPMKALEAAGRKSPTLGVSFDGQTLYLLSVSKAAAAGKALAGLSKAQKGLDVTLLHRLILEPSLGITKERVEHEIFFTHKAAEAVKRLNRGESGVVFFLNPTRIDQLRDVAGAGERMPQKSTYFYPKLVTGMAFNDLTGF
jgi:uncharacterized protein (DUF1015 family)